jgi:hypothetical protein
MAHRIGQQATAFADLRQPIIAHRQFAIDVLPSKGPLHFIAEAIKPPELPSDGDRRLGIATVWVDHRFHLVGFDGVLIVFGVKAGVQGSRRPAEIDPNATGKVHKGGEGFGQNDRILLVDGFDRNRSENKAVVFHNGELFVAFLVFMAGVAKALAPFFTTV